MPNDRVTVQHFVDLVERNRVSTDKMSETQLETAVAMEKLATQVAALGEKLDAKNDKRERLLFRAAGALIAIICLFAGVRVYDAFERSETRANRVSAPMTYELSADDGYPPPP